MTTYTAPPTQTGLTLNDGDALTIDGGGVATRTTINDGGVENVLRYGRTSDTTINSGGVQNVLSQGQSNYTTINAGGVENILIDGLSHGTTVSIGGVANVYGSSIETEIDAGGVVNIYSGGASVRTHIDGGVLHVFNGGTTGNVFFDGPNSTLQVESLTGLTGAIVSWGVGDVIDLVNIKVTDLHESAGGLTVTYGDQSATYPVLDRQAGTFVHAVSDGRGGTNLILTPIVGVHHSDPVALGDPALQIESLYVGYFGHAGDPAGMTYWHDQLIARHGNPDALEAIAASFSKQAEAQAAHPLLADPQHATQTQIASFITSLYENLFDRAPDVAGAAYWQQEFSANRGNQQAIGSFILNVIGGAQTQDAATLANKVEAAKYFSDRLGAEHLPFDAAAEAIAHTAVAGVTSDQATVPVAESIVRSFIDGVSSTTYTAPPTQLHLVLDHRDTLNVQDHGLAYDTINNGGMVNVSAGGTIVGTTINSADGNAGIVKLSGVATDTTINHGLLDVAAGGTSIHATVNNSGALWVDGLAIDTTLNDGGSLAIRGGTANNVTFGSPNGVLAVVGDPSSLTGTISSWQVGDVIDFLNTAVSEVHQTGNKLTVTYGDHTASYLLAGVQAGTEFQLQSDGTGGTKLILVEQLVASALDTVLGQAASAVSDGLSVQLVGVAHLLDHAGMA